MSEIIVTMTLQFICSVFTTTTNNHSFMISSTSETFTSEVPENLEEMFPCFYMNTGKTSEN